jgi:hypothetical protein
VAAAKQYLGLQGFSQQALIDQLDSSAGGGYSVNDATVAVDSLTVDWNAEAVQAVARKHDPVVGGSQRIGEKRQGR